MRIITVPRDGINEMAMSDRKGEIAYKGPYFWPQLATIVGIRTQNLAGAALLDFYECFKELKKQWEEAGDTLTIANEKDYQLILQWVKDNEQWLGDQPTEPAHNFIVAFMEAKEKSNDGKDAKGS